MQTSYSKKIEKTWLSAEIVNFYDEYGDRPVIRPDKNKTETQNVMDAIEYVYNLLFSEKGLETVKSWFQDLPYTQSPEALKKKYGLRKRLEELF